MTSALALGHAGLRLRSRRVRSGRSHRLSLGLLVATIATVSGVGVFVVFDTNSNTQPANVANAATPEQQHLIAGLRPIDAQIQRSVAQEGLLVAEYQSGQIDRAELQRQLGEVLIAYRDAASQVSALDLPPQMQATLQADAAALGVLTQSAAELSQAYDDGDQARVSAALANSLAATVRLHALADGPLRD
jgi:hypothetical protein